MNTKYNLPPTFQITFEKSDRHTYLLSASQIIAMPVEKAFSFFEKPENLFEITPDWLDFSFDHKGGQSKTYEGAEFDYTIRWLSTKIKWHTKIAEYHPPEMFTDVQVRGPYTLWRHLHTFSSVPEGTLMKDFVSYRIPFGIIGDIFHRVMVRSHLQNIFSYRAVRIAEWADGTFKSKLTTRNSSLI
ncbi:MAG: SRPBCC family protein [Nitrospirota bacterium]|nr:SRPBCC family protein [Nitrospirota bacterium]